MKSIPGNAIGVWKFKKKLLEYLDKTLSVYLVTN